VDLLRGSGSTEDCQKPFHSNSLVNRYRAGVDLGQRFPLPVITVIHADLNDHSKIDHCLPGLSKTVADRHEELQPRPFAHVKAGK
jgi:hypothetical protein